MKLSLQTPTGIEVTLSPTYFVDDCQHPQDANVKVLAPLMGLDAKLRKETHGNRVYSTKFLSMEDEYSRFGVFLIITDNKLTALLTDMRNPVVRRWQQVAQKHGYLPMLLQFESVTSLLEFPYDEDTASAFDVLEQPLLASVDSTQRAIGATISLADSIQSLPNLLPEDIQLESIRVHLVASEVASPELLRH